MLVYTLNGFCSALAGIVSASTSVLGPRRSTRMGLELTVIAAVVIGGTLLTGGDGYVFGTLFGVLIIGLIQSLIQFNGQLSSWWTRIVVAGLMLAFIVVQSALAVQKRRQSWASGRSLARTRQGIHRRASRDGRAGPSCSWRSPRAQRSPRSSRPAGTSSSRPRKAGGPAADRPAGARGHRGRPVR